MATTQSRPAALHPPARAGSGSRTLAFGGATLGVAWDTATTGGAVESLFADLPERPNAGTPPTTLNLETREVSRSYVLHRGDDLLWQGRTLSGLTAALLDEALRDLADRSRGGVMFHAAAVTKGGKSLAIPGVSGSGKTFLCAWLLRRGFEYLTDELVYVESSSRSLHGFPRPLHVKRRGFAVLRHLLPADAGKRVRVIPSGRLVPHRLLSPDFRHQTPEVGLLLLPRFDPSALGELRPLGRAEACRRLMACLINARNLEGHGLLDATRLTRAVESHALTYGSFDQLGRMLDPLLDRHFAL